VAASNPFVYSRGMTIATRLDKAMKRADIRSQNELARRSGVPQPTINRILKGGGKQGPATETLKKLAMACGVQFQWLSEGIGEERRTMPGKEITLSVPNAAMEDSPRVLGTERLSKEAKCVQIKRVKLRLSAGITELLVDPEEEAGHPVCFKRDWLTLRGYRAESLIALSVTGTSMEPSLYAGDTVVINTDDRQPRDGEVFAVNYEGEYLIRRLVRDSGCWWLSADSVDQRRFQRKRCGDKECTIIGRVIHKQSEII
jgi:phage repressor protein C with HTH and peptisase S24 domain